MKHRRRPANYGSFPPEGLAEGRERAAAVRPVLIISAGWDDCLVEGKGGEKKRKRKTSFAHSH